MKPYKNLFGLAVTVGALFCSLAMADSAIGDEGAETSYTYNESYIANTSSDGTSPNEKVWFISEVYTTSCYMPLASKISFKSKVERDHFKKVGFEYIHDGYVTSLASRQRASDDHDRKIARLQSDGWRIVRVSFSFDCEN